MIGIIGRKLGMTQIFNEAGQQIPCTVVEAAPNPVTKVMTKDAAGFDSIELGFETQRTARDSKKGERTPKGSRASASELGHAAKAGLSAAPAVLRSFRLDDAPGKNPEVPSYKVGDVITGIGYQFGDGQKIIRLEKVVLADGKTMSVYGG